MKKQFAFATLAVSALTLGSFMASAQETKTDAAPAADKEKCYGVAKMGKNDCASKAHSCAGHAATDAHKGEWVFVPKGLCDRLVNGSTTPTE